MANLRDIKIRIKSIKNIQKITNTMEKVATARSKKANRILDESLPYYNENLFIIDKVINNDYNIPGNHELKKYINPSCEKIAVLVITSDRGLCGGFNSRICHLANNFIKNKIKDGKEIFLYLVGKKAIGYFKKAKYSIKKTYTGIVENTSDFENDFIENEFQDEFKNGNIDSLVVFYQKYISASKQQPNFDYIIPFKYHFDNPDLNILTQEKNNDGDDSTTSSSNVYGVSSSGKSSKASEKSLLASKLMIKALEEESTKSKKDDKELFFFDDNEETFFELEPEADLGAEYIFPEAMKNLILSIRLQNHLSEHIARRIAMKQATESAGDMITYLTKLYNRTRQSKITNEIIEIVTSAKAIES